ncbi:MAG TPA: class I SAM-dependent methyltransferase [Myxococcaceae bacterium]|nr:class I SAM-dependent methyltransferase [Myxococcaceae bacterium]
MTTETIRAEGPNAEQIEFWNGPMGARWTRSHERLERMTEPLGLAAVERASPAPGEKILDVGTGCGGTSFVLAQRVAPNGSLTGVDVSSSMVQVCRQRADKLGLKSAQYVLADAGTHAFEPGSADLVFSQFGVMFFKDPVAAFSNLRKALKPTGRLVFTAWRAMPENAWAAVPMGVAFKFLPPPPRPDPEAPGPFSFADPNRLRSILEKAGFRDIEMTAQNAMVTISEPGADPVESGLSFHVECGPLGLMLAQADAETRTKILGALREVVAASVKDGKAQSGGSAWLVTAKP